MRSVFGTLELRAACAGAGLGEAAGGVMENTHDIVHEFRDEADARTLQDGTTVEQLV
jgi:hypothetical protein